MLISIWLTCGPAVVGAQEPIRVGILHSTTGTMAISETPLRDTLLMLIEDQNARGGLLGRTLEPVVYDPRSNWGLYAQYARRMFESDGVQVIFGCWTSASRKAVLPVLEEFDGLLIYPMQYEGQESSEHVVYTGAVPNQQALPAADYLRKQGIERWILAGTDYIYPRTANRILVAYLLSLGVADKDILLHYSPFSFADWQEPIQRFKRFAAEGKKTAIISTINGDANLGFYRELNRQNIKATELPVMALSVSEQEVASIGSTVMAGHFATWGYFMTQDTSANKRFIARWRKYSGNARALTNDPMEAHWLGFRLWLRAAQKTGTTEPAEVRKAIIGLQETNLSGDLITVLDNQHLERRPLVGQVQAGGQFAIMSTGPIMRAQPWSEFIE